VQTVHHVMVLSISNHSAYSMPEHPSSALFISKMMMNECKYVLWNICSIHLSAFTCYCVQSHRLLFRRKFDRIICLNVGVPFLFFFNESLELGFAHDINESMRSSIKAETKGSCCFSNKKIFYCILILTWIR